VGSEIRGEYTAVRNAASQIGIALAAAISGYAYDTYRFAGVSLVAAAFYSVDTGELHLASRALISLVSLTDENAHQGCAPDFDYHRRLGLCSS
jgi:hypothetical protein